MRIYLTVVGQYCHYQAEVKVKHCIIGHPVATDKSHGIIEISYRIKLLKLPLGANHNEHDHKNIKR